MKTYDLVPIFDNAASFYKKAVVHEKNQGLLLELQSYATTVAQIKNGKAQIYGIYSATTLRHIKEFLKQNNFIADNKNQIIKDYLN